MPRRIRVSIILLVLLSTSLYLFLCSTGKNGVSGPSVAEVERRGVMAYYRMRADRTCGPELRGPIKTCVERREGNELFGVQVDYASSGWMKKAVDRQGLSRIVVQTKTTDGFSATITFGKENDLLVKEHFQCSKAQQSLVTLSYRCQVRLEGRKPASLRHFVVNMRYNALEGRLHITHHDVGELYEAHTYLFDAQSRLLSFTLDIPRRPSEYPRWYVAQERILRIPRAATEMWHLAEMSEHEIRGSWWQRQLVEWSLQDESLDVGRTQMSRLNEATIVSVPDQFGNPQASSPYEPNSRTATFAYEYWETRDAP